MAKVRTKRGTKLSEGDLAALGAEAERGYDLERARRVRVGRPSLAGEAGASPRLQLRVDRELADELRSRAAKEGRSVSDLARDALRRYVARKA